VRGVNSEDQNFLDEVIQGGDPYTDPSPSPDGFMGDRNYDALYDERVRSAYAARQRREVGEFLGN
jgi:hypothetical protein